LLKGDLMHTSFDPRDFFNLADRLLNDMRYEKEARVRTAIGRAYYAAFLCSMKKLQELGCSFKDVDRLHKDVIEELRSRNGGLGSKLNSLFDHRVDADYILEAKVTHLGDKCCRLSEHIINSLEALH